MVRVAGSYGEKVSTVHRLTRSRLDRRETEEDKYTHIYIHKWL